MSIIKKSTSKDGIAEEYFNDTDSCACINRRLLLLP